MVIDRNQPEIHTFCEQPLCVQQNIGGEIVETIFDMWVFWKDGREEFVEIKYASELESNGKQGMRSRRQTLAQRLWCEENVCSHIVRTDSEIHSNRVYLSNMKLMIPYIRNHPDDNNLDKHKIPRLLRDQVRTIGEIEQLLVDLTSSRVRESIYRMIYLGRAFANSREVPFGSNTEVWLDGSQENN